MERLNNDVIMNADCGEPLLDTTAKYFDLAMEGTSDPVVDKAINEKHRRPKNIPGLKPPQINESVYKYVSKFAKGRDKSFKGAQHMIGKTLIPTLKCLEIFENKKTSSKKKLRKIGELMMDLIKLQTASYKQMTKMRRGLLEPDLGDQFKPLFKLKTKVTDQMFGSESELGDIVKKIEASEALFTKWASKNSRGRGPRGGFRGRRNSNSNFRGRRDDRDRDRGYQGNQDNSFQRGRGKGRGKGRGRYQKPKSSQ